MLGWRKHKLESRFPGEILITSDNADDTTFMAESEEELKSLLMKVKEESAWQIDAETVETVADFILGGSKITAEGDCSYEIKRHLLFGRKVMTSLDSILKSRDTTLPTKVHLVKAMVFQQSCMDVRGGL